MRFDRKLSASYLWRYAIATGAFLTTILLSTGCSHEAAGAIPGATGHAKVIFDKPVALTIDGGSCQVDGKGSVGANFNNQFAFNIGPATVGADALGMSKAPYKGPGTYHKVIITGYVKGKISIGGLGTIVVHSDIQTGTFVTDDGKAAGSWDCGSPLR